MNKYNELPNDLILLCSLVAIITHRRLEFSQHETMKKSKIKIMKLLKMPELIYRQLIIAIKFGRRTII
jgi:hypothetical protein